MASLDSTEGEEYTNRLNRLQTTSWKKVLDVQAPYRWNLRRLFGDRQVLEVGCGIGRCLSHLAPRGVGVDHNKHSIEECRQQGLTAFTTDEFFESEYAKPARFSGMLAAHLVEHMPREEAVKILEGYLEYLTPNARMVLICPQERGYASDSTHVAFSDFDALTDVAYQLGFNKTRRQSFPFPRFAGKAFTYNEFVLVADRTS